MGRGDLTQRKQERHEEGCVGSYDLQGRQLIATGQQRRRMNKCTDLTLLPLSGPPIFPLAKTKRDKRAREPLKAFRLEP